MASARRFQNHAQHRERPLNAGSCRIHELVIRLNGASVSRKSKVDKLDTPRSNLPETSETGHIERPGQQAGGRRLLGGTNRFGLRPARFAPPNNKSYKVQGRTEIWWKVDTRQNTRVKTAHRHP